MSIRVFLITVLYCIAGSVYAQEDISGLKKDSLKTISNEYLNSENPTVKPFAVKEEMPEIKPETDIPQMEIQEIRYPRPFYMPYYTNPSPMFYGDYSTNGKIAPNPNASNMFGRFVNLKEINFGRNFDTSNVTNMSYMFYNCRSLTKLDLSYFHASSATNTTSMFKNCDMLKTLIGSDSKILEVFRDR